MDSVFLKESVLDWMKLKTAHSAFLRKMMIHSQKPMSLRAFWHLNNESAYFPFAHVILCVGREYYTEMVTPLLCPVQLGPSLNAVTVNN